MVNVVIRLGLGNSQQNQSYCLCPCRRHVGPRKVTTRGRPLGADWSSTAGQWSVNTAHGVSRRRQCTVVFSRPSSILGRRRHVVGLRMSRAVNPPFTVLSSLSSRMFHRGRFCSLPVTHCSGSVVASSRNRRCALLPAGELRCAVYVTFSFPLLSSLLPLSFCMFTFYLS